MDPALASAVIGVPLSVSITAFAIAFARLRSDMHAGFDRLEARFDRLEACLDDGFDRLEACFNDLVVAVGRNGRSADPNGSRADY